jgi:hypothetical protein
MSSVTEKLSRRTILKGIGTAMALPALEAFSFGQDAPKFPLRTGVVFFPNGVITDHWFPSAAGDSFELPKTLRSLEPHRKELYVFSGLTHDKARANGDGPGDHARSAGSFLTARQPKKTDGRDIRAGVSLDQLIAQRNGQATRLPSLEIGCDKGAMAGNCDSGYSCAYSSAISWRSETQPNAKEVNPRAVFERLFGDPGQVAAARDRARQLQYRKSVLDLVQEDAKSLGARLGTADQRKVEEYLDSVRSVERRIQSSEREGVRPAPEMEAPQGVPPEFAGYVRLMMDLMVVAFQTDTTRVATFMLANEGSNRTFPQIEVRDGHHSLSHHARNAEKMAKIQKIDQFYVEQYAYLLEKMRSIREGDGTLLDHSMLIYGCSICDGNRHNHDNLPVLLAGRANGTLKPGRHVIYPRNTPMANLFLELLDRVGIKEERFGDSTGRLPDLV